MKNREKRGVQPYHFSTFSHDIHIAPTQNSTSSTSNNGAVSFLYLLQKSGFQIPEAGFSFHQKKVGDGPPLPLLDLPIHIQITRCKQSVKIGCD